MSAKQSKRAKFAHRQRVQRLTARITRRNSGLRGFVGACHNFTITDEFGNVRHFGSGAMFIVGDTARRSIITSITRD